MAPRGHEQPQDSEPDHTHPGSLDQLRKTLSGSRGLYELCTFALLGPLRKAGLGGSPSKSWQDPCTVIRPFRFREGLAGGNV